MTTASLNGRAHTGGVTDDDIDPPACQATSTVLQHHYNAEILAEYDSWSKGSEERGATLRRPHGNQRQPRQDEQGDRRPPQPRQP